MQLPSTDDSFLIRTDFRDDSAWARLCAAVQEPVGDMRAYVACVNDRTVEDASVAQLVNELAHASKSFFFVADRKTIDDAEHPILVVDLLQRPTRSFRVVPREAWGVENNLSLANMDFDEFAGAADDDGVFRGFRDTGSAGSR